jgi:hypothetical protein
MTDKQWYQFWRIIKYILMLGVPAGYAIIKWGFVSTPENNTVIGRIALGGIVAGVLSIQFLSDLIKHWVEQYKLTNRISFMRNHTFQYTMLGLLMLAAYFVAYDAMIFFFVGAASNLLAYLAEYIEKHYYKAWKGL